jgi:hypothetical protein
MKNILIRVGATVRPVATNKRVLVAVLTATAALAGSALPQEALETLATLILALVGF